MALDNDFSFGTFSLPSLDPPLHPPARNPSRRISRRGSGPPTHLIEKDGEEIRNGEGKISILDPRRFTPTLHANLVSEILSLRREVESKSKLVLNLEESLLSSKEETSKLNETLAENGNETRHLKRQMQMLEGGSSSALEELAKDRDTATKQLAEFKKQLDASQKKVKSKDEEVDRTNGLWERDRENWDAERRNLDLKVHVVESRLKTVLSEIEAAQVQGRPRSSVDFVDRPLSRTSGIRSAASHRRGSSASLDGAGAKRFRLSHISEIDNSGANATLADELQFDDEFDDDGFDAGMPVSPEALPEEYTNRARPFSALSHRQSVKARKVLGLDIEDEGDENFRDAKCDTSDMHASVLQNIRGPAIFRYTDTATQFSPPPSPNLAPIHMVDAGNDSGLERPFDMSNVHYTRNTSKALSEKPAKATGNDSPRTVSMVSSACQTIEQPLSPPATPTDSKKSALASIAAPKVVEMSTVATQTLPEDVPPVSPPPAASRDGVSDSIGIPIIAIRPPTSSGLDRNSVALPPGTKNVGCQASVSPSLRSISVQTDAIKIDQRPIKLPPHLLPSAISSNPSSPAPERQKAKAARSEPEPAQWTKLRPPSIIQPKHPKRLAKDLKDDPSVGFEGGDEADFPTVDANDGNISDDSFLNKEPIRKTLSKVQNSWKTVSHTGGSLGTQTEEKEGGTATIFGSSARPENEPNNKYYSTRPGPPVKSNKAGKVLEPISTGKQADIRRTALISSGTAAHVQRSRSPSLPALPSAEMHQNFPPFPVPTRSSSRKFPWETSEGSPSPTPGTVSFFSSEQPQRKQQRPPTKKPVLRKIRSATNEPYQPQRSRSRSPPPPTSPSSYAESPRFPHPPLPNDDIASPYRMSFKNGHSEHNGHSGPTQSVATSAAESAGSEQTSVVDAIAQTMIGEWMWKYVRRRKSFGLPDKDDYDGKNEAANGIRHQRWVWLAPYERAVMWSSKQPMSGPALMGKSGRKLTIQSVLDVKDDAPMPKGAGSASCFGRSILILTPQRALKFTATTRERHYIWLTALSFLSHSSVVPNELSGPPPPSSSGGNPNMASLNQPDFGRHTFQSQPTTATLRRHPIRDSIRVAKGKSRPVIPNGGRRAYTSPTNLSLQASPQEEALYEYDEPHAAAEAPHVPRTSTHARKRSNTGPKTSFRSFSSSAKPSLPSFHSFHSSNSTAGLSTTGPVRPSTHSVHSGSGRGGGDVGSEASYHWTMDGGYGNMSRSQLSPAEQHEELMMMPDWAAEPLSGQGGAGANFFDAVGTMRMEAFVKDRWGGPSVPGGSGGALLKERGMSVSGASGRAPGYGNNGPSGPGGPGGFAGYGVGGSGGAGSSAGDRVRGSFRTRQGRKKDFAYWGGGSEVKVGGNRDPFEGF